MQHEIHHIDYRGYLGEVPRPGIMVFLDNPWETIDAKDFTDVENNPK